jgi:hypothetical protein
MSVRRLLVAVFASALVSCASLAVLSAQALAAGAPIIVTNGMLEIGTWSVEVGYSTATIKAEINPNEAATTYRFEYGPTTSYGASIPSPDGEIGLGTEPVEVSQRLTNIQAGTTYHYRVVATNAEGTTYGPDEIFITFPAAPPAGVDTCPNAAFRVGWSALLPDCRAYEMVSPVDKNGGDILADEPRLFTSAASGERVAFFSGTSFGAVKGSGTGGTTQFMAARGTGGWGTHGITPTPAPNTPAQAFLGNTKALAFSNEPVFGGHADDHPARTDHEVRRYGRTHIRLLGLGQRRRRRHWWRVGRSKCHYICFPG